MNEGMSTAPDTADGADAQQAVQTLRRRVDALSSQLETVRDDFAEEREQRLALEDEVKRLRDDKQQLEARVSDLEARTDMLRLVEEADELDYKQRRLALLHHLERKALEKADRPDEAVQNQCKASIDHELAEEVLHYPDIDRTTLYNDMRKAAEMVGDGRVCWYDGSKPASLHLNLERAADGQLPEHIKRTSDPLNAR